MAMVKDPVCGMEIDSSLAPAQTIYEDQAYFFCSDACLEAFEENPEAYIDDSEFRDQSPLPMS